MNELRELYQEVILDHNKNPRNYHTMPDATHSAEGDNPLCGDHYHVYLKVKDGVVEDVSFEGEGCAISKASASLMSTVLKGKTIEEAEKLFTSFHDLVTTDVEPDLESLGKLAVFSGVRDFPIRVKCASLSWHTMHAALQTQTATVTTEK